MKVKRFSIVLVSNEEPLLTAPRCFSLDYFPRQTLKWTYRNRMDEKIEIHPLWLTTHTHQKIGDELLHCINVMIHPWISHFSFVSLSFMTSGRIWRSSLVESEWSKQGICPVILIARATSSMQLKWTFTRHWFINSINPHPLLTLNQLWLAN